MFLDILDRLFHSESVPSNDRCWVDLLLDKFISIRQQLFGDVDHTGGSLTNLLVLQGGQLHQDLGCRVHNLQNLKDCSSIIGDGDISNVIYHHLVQSHRSQASLDNIGNTGCCHHILSPVVLSPLMVRAACNGGQADDQISLKN